MTIDKPASQRSYDDFTYVPKLIFSSIGYDFLDTSRPRWLNIFLRIYWIQCQITHLYFVYYLIRGTIESDELAGNPTAMMRYAIVYFFCLNSDVKFCIFLYHRRRLRALNDKLQALYPKDDKERQDYRVNEFFWPRISRLGVCYYYLVAFVIVCSPIIQSSFIYFNQRLTSEGNVTFQYLSTYPMERIKVMTPLKYAFSQMVDIVFTHFVVNINLGTDIFMMCFSGQLCMHFAQLGRKLASYNPSKQRENEDCEFLVSLVKKHEILFNLHKDLNDSCGMMLAYNVFSTATILCCVAFYTILQGLNREGAGFLMFFFSSSSQFYMVSYYGQMLIDFSESIALAAYSHNWYNGTPKYRKYLLMIMQRAQRPAELSAKGVIIISRDTFKNMMNSTYRLLALLRRLLGK